MTLNYKILGQLYYGPEINETPEIPGTSGYYTYTTGSIGNIFFATSLGNAASAYSTDGINWNQTTLPDRAFFVFNANNTFIATGISDSAAYSTDGITWTATTMPAVGTWAGLAYGDGKFVAIMYDSDSAAYSTDGITWTATTMPAVASWNELVYEDGKFVAINSNSIQGAYSTDGITWTATTMPSDPLSTSWRKLAYGGGKFVALTVSSSSRLAAYSTDGITWTATTLPDDFSAQFLVYANNKFVALQPGRDFIVYSGDGITWATASLPDNSFRALEYGNNKFVAVGLSTQAAYSTDGITWTTTTMPSQNWNNLVYADNKFVATYFAVLSDNNKVAYSIDGISWAQSTLPALAKWDVLADGQVNTLQEVQISIGGQGTPGSYVEITEPQVVYTVPNGTETTITSIFVTNHDSVERTFDLAVVPVGETLSLKHHIRWDMPVSATDFDLSNAKITMSAGDRVFVFPSTINKVGFTLFGVEKHEF